jgi:hypothetical protein
MTLKIEFEGFVNEVKTFDWGTVASVAHAQRAKNAQGEWETVGKDYVDVTLPEGVIAIENTKVKIVGSLKPDAYLNKNGEAKPRLKVRAWEFDQIDRTEFAPAPQVTRVASTLDLVPADEDLPF